jgi:hypothetical protein
VGDGERTPSNGRTVLITEDYRGKKKKLDRRKEGGVGLHASRKIFKFEVSVGKALCLSGRQYATMTTLEQSM